MRSTLPSSTTMAPSNSTVPSNKTQFPEGELFTWHAAELIFIPLVIFIGVVGNLLCLYIYHFRWKSTTVTLFKRMLAALDLVSLTLAFPVLLATIIEPANPRFMFYCGFASFVALTSAAASSGVLLIIAADRYMKLCLLRKVGVGKPLAKKLFALIVVIASIFNLPTFWYFGRDQTDYPYYRIKVSYCFINQDSKSVPFFLAWIGVLNVQFFVVTHILMFLYYKIVKQLRELSTKHEELKRRPSLAANTEVIKKQKQSEFMRKTAVVFIAVTVVFFASYAPYMVSLVIMMMDNVLGSMGPGTKAVFDLAKMCPALNNVANPLIYSFTSGHFRKEVKKMLTFKTCQKGQVFRRRGFSVASRSNEMSNMTESMSGAEPV